MGRTPRGVRGLKSCGRGISAGSVLSHPARGAWIEIDSYQNEFVLGRVAPREGCVD